MLTLVSFAELTSEADVDSAEELAALLPMSVAGSTVATFFFLRLNSLTLRHARERVRNRKYADASERRVADEFEKWLLQQRAKSKH